MQKWQHGRRAGCGVGERVAVRDEVLADSEVVGGGRGGAGLLAAERGAWGRAGAVVG